MAQRCGIQTDLGVKQKSGIRDSIVTRAAFLSDESHRIGFVYIPKHTSWLNQIECWFSILAKGLLRRSSFSSTSDLKQKILNFIDYFNCTLARPYVLEISWVWARMINQIQIYAHTGSSIKLYADHF